MDSKRTFFRLRAASDRPLGDRRMPVSAFPIPKQILDLANKETNLLIPTKHAKVIKETIKKLSEAAIQVSDSQQKTVETEAEKTARHHNIKHRIYKKEELAKYIEEFPIPYDVYFGVLKKLGIEVTCCVMPVPLFTKDEEMAVLLAQQVDNAHCIYALKYMDYEPREIQIGYMTDFILGDSIIQTESKQEKPKCIHFSRYIEKTLADYVDSLGEKDELDFDILINMFKVIEKTCIQKGILHLDIKLSNLLLWEKQVFICDYGTARVVPKPSMRPLEFLAPTEQDCKDLQFTRGYAAPETTLKQPQLSEQCEIYALGVCAGMLGDITTPLKKSKPLPSAQKIEDEMKNNKRIPLVARAAFRRSIEIMTAKNRLDRPATIGDCIKFFEGLRAVIEYTKFCELSFHRRQTAKLENRFKHIEFAGIEIDPVKPKPVEALLAELEKSILKLRPAPAKSAIP